MGEGNQMRQWVAHVGLSNGSVVEVKVWDVNKYMASEQVYKRLGLDGAADRRIQSYVIDELSEKTSVVEDVVPDVPARDKTKDRRYRVRMYLSPRAHGVTGMTMRTSSAEQALWSLMGMHRVKEEGLLGPYCVEQGTNGGGWVTVKYKHLHAFPDHGPLVASDGYDPPARTTPASAENSFDEEWNRAWQQVQRDTNREWPNNSRNYSDLMKQEGASQFIAGIRDIFKDEKTVKTPVYTITRK